MSLATQAFWLFVAAVATAAVITTLLLAAMIRQQRRYLLTTRQLNQRLLAAHEEERAWVARELHDGVIQHVAVVSSELSDLEHHCNNGSQDVVSRRLEGVRAELSALAQEIRRVAHRMHPSVLDNLGLPAALRALGEEMQATHRLVVRVLVPEDLDLQPQPAACLYRVAQEALRNVVRHAGVGAAEVVLTDEPSGITLTVRDAGRGFIPRTATAKAGLGLTSMAERMRLVGGRFELASAPGQGSRITVWVPRTSEART